jgi:hypothetical protein
VLAFDRDIQGVNARSMDGAWAAASRPSAAISVELVFLAMWCSTRRAR